MISKIFIDENSVQSIWKQEKARAFWKKLSNGSMEIIQIILMKKEISEVCSL